MFTSYRLNQRFFHAVVVAAVFSPVSVCRNIPVCGLSVSTVDAVAATIALKPSSAKVATVLDGAEKHKSLEKTEPENVQSESTEAERADIAEPINLSLAIAQLSDLRQFPLFLPETRGALITTDQQLSSTDLSEPSLFRIQDQLGQRYNSRNLVEQWQAYQVNAGLKYVDVVVNESFWRQLNYFRRYAFVSQLGRTTGNDGYHLRIFHSGDAANRKDSLSPGGSLRGRASRREITLRGAYFCDFQQTELLDTAQSCRLFLRR